MNANSKDASSKDDYTGAGARLSPLKGTIIRRENKAAQEPRS